MAIDPSIITAGMRQPEQVDPMGVLGKVLTLRNQQGQAQAQQQEAQLRGQAIQENDLKIAGINRAASGRQALTTILQNPESYDPTTAQPKHAQVAQQLAQAGFSDEAEAWLKQSSTNAEALEKLRSTAQAHSEAAQEAIGGLAATSQSPQEFDASLGLLATHGVLDPKMAQQIASEADAAGPDGWKAFRDKYVHLAPSSRKSAMENAELLQKPTKLGPGENLVIPATGTTVATGGSNSTKESKSMLVDGKPAEVVFDNKSAKYTQGDQVIDPSRVKPIPPASMQVVNSMGDAAHPSDIAKAIATYKVAPPSPRTLATPAGEMLMAQVMTANPDYDSSKFSVRASTRKGFTTGTQGQQVTALNTAIEHLDQLQAAADALKNGSFTPGNSAYNALRQTFGVGAPTNYDAIKNMVDKEVEAVANKGVPTVSGTAEQKALASKGASPEQIKGYIDTLIPLMGSKLNALHHQYTEAMGANDDFKPLTPQAQQILSKRGFDPNLAPKGGGVTVSPPSGGKSYSFPDQAAADKFVAEAKAKGLWK